MRRLAEQSCGQIKYDIARPDPNSSVKKDSKAFAASASTKPSAAAAADVPMPTAAITWPKIPAASSGKKKKDESPGRGAGTGS